MGDNLIDGWCDYHHALHDVTRSRRVDQRRVLHGLEGMIEGGIEAVDSRDIERYMAQMITDGYHPHTVLYRLKMIRTFLRWMWGQGLIDSDRWLRLQAVRGPRNAYDARPKPYTRQEMRKFWLELDQRYPWTRDRPQLRTPARGEHWVRRWAEGKSPYTRVYPYARRLQVEAIVALAIYGGLRRNEIYNIAIEDMHHHNEYVRVVGARKGNDGHPKVRVVAMNKMLALAVGNWIEFREQVMQPGHDFPWICLWAGTRRHPALSATSPMNHRRFCDTVANIGKGWELHRLRHTFATERYRAGMPVEILQPTLGHATIGQTLRYARIDEDKIIAVSKATDVKFLDALRPDSEAA